jgi:hypothetical protein
MAESRMMTAADVVAQVMGGEHGDVLREAVAPVARALMEAEVSARVGAEHGERSPDRVTHRNGYRPRAWETRVGEIELLIPRARSGPAYFPSFLEPRRRCEQAIVAVVMEAYVNGVSTRKVDRLVEQLGIQGMDKDRVSRLCSELDEHVERFRTRPLEGAYPYLWLDAKHLKVRDCGRVVSKALVVAYAVHGTGVREVIGLDLGEVESEAFWVEFLRSLRSRGLDGVRLAISDHHEGLKNAIARILGCPWQRCAVHFVRAHHHEELGLTEEEAAFYDALAGGVEHVTADPALAALAHELVESIRSDLSVDWTDREATEAKIRTKIKRLLRRNRDMLFELRPLAPGNGGGTDAGGYIADGINYFTQLVLDQAKALYRYWPEVGDRLFDEVR